MKKGCKLIYRFFCYDGKLFFAYTIRSKCLKRAKRRMHKIIERDFPEFDIIDIECLNLAVYFRGKLYIPEYLSDFGVMCVNALKNEDYVW